MRVLTGHKFDKKFESEFSPMCEATTGCDNPATWMAWSAHGRDTKHKECFAYCCDACRQLAIDLWQAYLGKRCVCGYTVDGTIDKHLRFLHL